MKYPIAKVKTPDGLQLFGYHTPSSDSDTVLLNIHGTGSDFYVEEFEEEFHSRLPVHGVATLFIQNRGHHVMDYWQKTGAALEMFEDCLIDIDTWIECAFSLGYTKIILQGHSLGTEKVVYYMNRGKHADKVIGVILLGFADSYGNTVDKPEKVGGAVEKLLTEARAMVRDGKGDEFLRSCWNCHAGVLPKSAASFLNFFSPNSELSKALPLRKGKDLLMYRNIKVPILGIVGELDQWTMIPVEDAAELLRMENKSATVHIIPGSGHSFEGYEKQLVDIVTQFINSRLHL